MQASHLGPTRAHAGAHQQRGSSRHAAGEGTLVQAGTLQAQHCGIKRAHEAADEQHWHATTLKTDAADD